ncbi:acyl carrier protein [Streptomyces filamentosus]|uniref:Acyl carrier protein n=2 Tax=Streptomyces filamentosus TaxID=67294 RepID=A0ABY4UV80_STRFL|nr:MULTISPECIES: acyl carrier protein [Streptomyces]MCC8479925.1 acyl carrier protein [Streptomyces globisporus]EFE76300.1 predicted protein [Streptomyces filamentosus NRRL 15998]ESU49517.1 hypothetical protein P376_2503 [Streptomyces sp. HCCB10043]EWS93279.1 hypothetical protein SSIG_03866 [Streptomyces filamentosus NRRL 11379]MYR80288.1 acyl carrier protein [Streptomyces sp. SID5466]
MSVPTPVRGELTAMLAAVGLDPALGEAALSRSFEDLGLDSLARVELASRVLGGFGLDIEDDITPGATPEDVEQLIQSRLSATV